MNIVKRIFIGVSVAMCVWFLKTEVFALTVDTRYQISEPLVNGSYVSAGTIMTYSNTSSAYSFGSVFVRFSQTFFPDTIYRVSFQYRVDTNFYTYHTTCPDFYSITSDFELISTSCSEIGNRVAQFEVAFKSPDTSSSYVTFGLKYTAIFPRNYSTSYQVMSNSWSIVSVDSTYDAVINNTQVISNAVDGISNILDNIYNQQTEQIGFAQSLLNVFQYVFDSSEEYLPHYGGYISTNVSGYSQAHTSGSFAGGSGVDGANSLTFDPTLYEDSSTTIWDFLYRLLSSNAQMLTYLTSILTLGFVKVVLNR